MFTPTPSVAPIVPPAANRNQSSGDPWLLWRSGVPAEPQRLSVAELAECRCPDLCNRDHDND